MPDSISNPVSPTNTFRPLTRQQTQSGAFRFRPIARSVPDSSKAQPCKRPRPVTETPSQGLGPTYPGGRPQCPKLPSWRAVPSPQPDTITVELVEADVTPAVVIVRWPAKPTVIHPQRFADAAAVICPQVRRSAHGAGWHQSKAPAVKPRKLSPNVRPGP